MVAPIMHRGEMSVNRAIGIWLWMTLFGVGIAWAASNTTETRLKLFHDYAVSVNEVRLARGLPPLKLNETLCEAAQTYAETLLQTGQIRHADPQGRRADSRVATVGYFYSCLGENLAAGQLSWERALQMWLQSPSHRANLLNADYRELGIGFAADDTNRYRTTWTQLLGARRHTYPIVINLDAFATDSPMVSVYVHGARKAQAMRYRIDESDWSEWQTPSEWLRCRLPNREGYHAVTVQLRIGERVYEASDEIYLQSPIHFPKVASEGQHNDESRTRCLQHARAGIERAACGEYIVQQSEGAPLNTVRANDLERVLHILKAFGLAQPHLRASVAPPTECILQHGDA
ncbi:MAG: hypothetical protein CFK49_02505 [Armatimonadetes bacterium JP3_11]|nr:MAG: hypothetical protein CFK49_02505 [Armatimonadetes bacterium JP3_11]RMH09741.1 MAG: CAP domain-containing protein [Armatimonadota bacterium]